MQAQLRTAQKDGPALEGQLLDHLTALTLQEGLVCCRGRGRGAAAGVCLLQPHLSVQRLFVLGLRGSRSMHFGSHKGILDAINLAEGMLQKGIFVSLLGVG